MTPTDQTPDAVRAAIAEALDDSFADTIDAYVENDETANAYLRGDLIRTVFTVLDRIGALRPVGDGVMISVDDAETAREALEYAWAMQEDLDNCVTLDDVIAARRNLKVALAAARAGDGAT